MLTKEYTTITTTGGVTSTTPQYDYQFYSVNQSAGDVMQIRRGRARLYINKTTNPKPWAAPLGSSTTSAAPTNYAACTYGIGGTACTGAVVAALPASVTINSVAVTATAFPGSLVIPISASASALNFSGLAAIVFAYNLF